MAGARFPLHSVHALVYSNICVPRASGVDFVARGDFGSLAVLFISLPSHMARINGKWVFIAYIHTRVTRTRRKQRRHWVVTKCAGKHCAKKGLENRLVYTALFNSKIYVEEGYTIPTAVSPSSFSGVAGTRLWVSVGCMDTGKPRPEESSS